MKDISFSVVCGSTKSKAIMICDRRKIVKWGMFKTIKYEDITALDFKVAYQNRFLGKAKQFLYLRIEANGQKYEADGEVSILGIQDNIETILIHFKEELGL